MRYTGATRCASTWRQIPHCCSRARLAGRNAKTRRSKPAPCAAGAAAVALPASTRTVEFWIQNTGGYVGFWGYTITAELENPPYFPINAGFVDPTSESITFEWAEAADPDGVEYTLTITDWKADVETTAADFTFTPPAGAKQLDQDALAKLNDVPPPAEAAQ